MDVVRDKHGMRFAIIDSVNTVKDGLMFYGDRNDLLQVGGFKYQKGKILRSHKHLLRERNRLQIHHKTQEIMIVLKGSCEVNLFDLHKLLLRTAVLKAGDFVILYVGYIGFEILEDNTVMIEAKNGPYNVESDDEDREYLTE